METVSSSSSFLAFSTFLLAMGITTGYIYRYGEASFTFVYDKWIGLTTAALLMSTVQSIYVYAMSFQSGKVLALGGNSGNFIYDVCNIIKSSSIAHSS